MKLFMYCNPENKLNEIKTRRSKIWRNKYRKKRRNKFDNRNYKRVKFNSNSAIWMQESFQWSLFLQFPQKKRTMELATSIIRFLSFRLLGLVNNIASSQTERNDLILEHLKKSHERVVYEAIESLEIRKKASEFIDNTFQRIKSFLSALHVSFSWLNRSSGKSRVNQRML